MTPLDSARPCDSGAGACEEPERVRGIRGGHIAPARGARRGSGGARRACRSPTPEWWTRWSV